ncbi:hypothetical protein MPER_13119, partial [Moniliophthora perniciosa FA553]
SCGALVPTPSKAAELDVETPGDIIPRAWAQTPSPELILDTMAHMMGNMNCDYKWQDFYGKTHIGPMNIEDMFDPAGIEDDKLRSYALFLLGWYTTTLGWRSYGS